MKLVVVVGPGCSDSSQSFSDSYNLEKNWLTLFPSSPPPVRARSPKYAGLCSIHGAPHWCPDGRNQSNVPFSCKKGSDSQQLHLFYLLPELLSQSSPAGWKCPALKPSRGLSLWSGEIGNKEEEGVSCALTPNPQQSTNWGLGRARSGKTLFSFSIRWRTSFSKFTGTESVL